MFRSKIVAIANPISFASQSKTHPSMDNQSTTGLLFSQDLFFTSQITGTASKLGHRIQVVGNSNGAGELLTSEIRCVIFDLSMPGLSLSDVLSQIPESQSVGTVAYGSHVNTTLLNAAREAGCTEVLPKSRFTAELPEIIKRYMS